MTDIICGWKRCKHCDEFTLVCKAKKINLQDGEVTADDSCGGYTVEYLECGSFERRED